MPDTEHGRISDPAERQELLDLAHALADAASACAYPYFRSAALGIETKSTQHFDPVTAADRAAETAMRALIARHRPGDAIIGEEFPPKAGTTGLTWVLDPIDGTRAFVSGAPTWGILIGLDAGAGPVLGIIDQPHLRERFVGGFGEARLHRDGVSDPMRTRACDDLTQATLYTTFPGIGTEAERRAFERVRDRVRLTRYGFDCYAYALLALGQIDLVIEAGLNTYDIQGPQAVIEAAGGLVTDWRGGPAHHGGRVLAAGDARLHHATMALLEGVDA